MRTFRDKPCWAASGWLLATSLAGAIAAAGQQPQAKSAPIVQPGAPGMPSRRLPASTTGQLPPESKADVDFMQEMIQHHAQAVEMTALIGTHTENKELAKLGERISRSQEDEMAFMKRWLAARGETLPMAMDAMPSMAMPSMPGMLTMQQMEALRQARGPRFDRLFLNGMIQHHEGALTMVKQLFETPGAGQDADLFDFATGADNTQRAEIEIMQGMLQHMPKEKQ